MRKVNGCPKNIGLGNIFINLLSEKKIVTNFFYSFLYFSPKENSN